MTATSFILNTRHCQMTLFTRVKILKYILMSFDFITIKWRDEQFVVRDTPIHKNSKGTATAPNTMNHKQIQWACSFISTFILENRNTVMHMLLLGGRNNSIGIGNNFMRVILFFSLCTSTLLRLFSIWSENVPHGCPVPIMPSKFIRIERASVSFATLLSSLPKPPQHSPIVVTLLLIPALHWKIFVYNQDNWSTTTWLNS